MHRQLTYALLLLSVSMARAEVAASGDPIAQLAEAEAQAALRPCPPPLASLLSPPDATARLTGRAAGFAAAHPGLSPIARRSPGRSIGPHPGADLRRRRRASPRAIEQSGRLAQAARLHRRLLRP